MKTFVYSQKMKISLTSLVAIVLEERIVGHVPKNMSKISHRYMTIPRKRVDREAGYGLEIPVQCKFIGAKKAVEWAKKRSQQMNKIKNCKRKKNL